MKRTWIAITILTITIAFCICGFFVVESRGEKLTQMIDGYAAQISESPDADLKEIAEKINKEWSNNSTLFKSIFIHNEFSEIETLLKKLHVYAKQNDNESFYENCNEAVSRLHCALDDQKPKIQNIF